MRGGYKRAWIKLHCVGCLEGSIRYQLEADERGVWYDLLVLAGMSHGDGLIADNDKRAYPHSFIANRLNVSFELLERTLAKCQAEGRIIDDAQGILIKNWGVYQSEYSRQKPYRQKRRPEDYVGGTYGDIVQH